MEEGGAGAPAAAAPAKAAPEPAAAPVQAAAAPAAVSAPIPTAAPTPTPIPTKPISTTKTSDFSVRNISCATKNNNILFRSQHRQLNWSLLDQAGVNDA